MKGVPRELFRNLEGLSWFPFSDEPIIQSHPLQVRLSNPAVLLPEESTDEKWHLFAHSMLGIHHYTSESGISWSHQRLLIPGGRYPSLFEEDGTYHLIYEQRGRFVPRLGKRGRVSSDEIHHESHIELMSSTDLYIWSRPRHLMSAKSIEQTSLPGSVPTLSHPQLVSTDHEYRLYMGASSIDEDDRVARFVVSASAPQLLGPYHQETKDALVEAAGNEYHRSLGAGQLSVYESEGVYKALETSYFYDEKKNNNHSAIIVVDSEDGLSFPYDGNQPILVPSERGWASGNIRTCTLKYKADEKCWYCFFSASAKNNFSIERESIGLLLGKEPHPRKMDEVNDILYRNS